MAGREAGLVGGGSRRPEGSGPADPLRCLTAIGEAAFTWDLATDGLVWGPNAAAVLGVTPRSLFGTGQALSQAIEPEAGAGRMDALGSGSDDGYGVPYAVRYGLRAKTDRLILVEETGRWFGDASGRPAVVRGVVRASRAAGAEAMTAGLRARAALLGHIADHVIHAQRSRHGMTLIVGAFERQDGEDVVLSEIGHWIRPILRRGDRFVVYGPNRFALVLASCPAAEAEGAIRRLLALLDGMDPGGAGRLRIGAASAPDHAADAPGLLRHAEEALQQAFNDLTRPYAVDGSGPAGAPTGPCGTAADLLVHALNERRLVLAREPVIDARSRAPVLGTARLWLLRGPGRQLAPVGDLPEAAERAGLSTLLDARALELAADHLVSHPDERICLDIAPATLHGSEWLTVLAAHLGARPGIESRLLVGIPESVLRVPAARGRLDAMKALGVGIVLSGFGTGCASGKHLRGLPLDLLRIDGAFVQNGGRSPDDRLLLRTLADVAQHLGIASVAEGVEDEETARLLAGCGVDYLQGRACGPVGLPAASPAPSTKRSAA